MKYKRVLYVMIVLLAVSSLTSCTSSRKQLLKTDKTQLELRQIQSRKFETNDKNKTLRTIMATLQDLGFVIDDAEESLGTVSATKLDGYALVMNVTVRPQGKDSLIVRASAQYQLKTIIDPEPYQDFFTALSKAMFLEAQQVQ
jgi:hypothetical protein